MRARLRAGSAVTSCPKSSTRPLLGGNSPEIRLNSVVLPAPLGPRIGPALAGPHLEVHVAHGVDAAEAAVDPPQAEDRLGALGRLLRVLPLAPYSDEKSPSSDLPTHGGASPLSHFGFVAVGRGRVGREDPVERLVDLR